MTPYAVETMSRHELRKCYNRYCWAVMLLFPTVQLTAYALMALYSRTGSALFAHPIWGKAIPALINAVSAYLPALALFLLLFRRFPRPEKLPVDRLGLWEFLQAAVFALGVCFLFNILTYNLIGILERAVGESSANRVALHDAASPFWEQVIFSVLIPPVCEELLFRRLMLDRLRPLGDVSAVYLSALAFALYHNNLYQMLYAFVLGVFFAMLVLLTGSIRDTILLHMVVNGATVFGNRVPFPWFEPLRAVLYTLCALLAIVLYITQRRSFRLEPGPLALSSRDKRRACLGSLWFYLMLAVCIGGSVFVIFL